MIIDLGTARALARSRGKVYDSLGNKIGTIGQVYVDDETGQPNWVTVRTGLFGLAESFAPLDGAELRGGDLYVLPGEIDVKGAPRIDPDGSLTPDEEEQLYTHYASANAGAEESADGVGSTTGGAAPAVVSEPDSATDRTPRRVEPQPDTESSTADPIRRPSRDHTRTEGELDGGRRLLLRKYVVTDEVSVTVPVQREEVRLEPENDEGNEASSAGLAAGGQTGFGRGLGPSDRTGR